MAAVESLVSRWDAVTAAAREASDAAARRAAVTLQPVEGLDDIAAVSELFAQIWERSGEPPTSTELLRALSHSGNYVVAAHQDGRPVGALIGFLGRGNGGGPHLHSHILGVRAGARVGGVGFALKVHQRAWALERRIASIVWTFDPLARGNAFFNLAKLAAVGDEYHVNFYGAMPDIINDGDESDRLVVRWALADADVQAAAAGSPRQPDVDGLRASGAVVALSVGPDGAAVRGAQDGDILLAQIPADAVTLRRADPAAAMAWRRELRGVMTNALARGLAVRGVTRDGWYVLSASAL